MNETKNLETMLIDYVAGTNIDFSQFKEQEENVREQFALFNQKWEQLECDDEGFNREQSKEADELIQEYTNKIKEIMKG